MQHQGKAGFAHADKMLIPAGAHRVPQQGLGHTEAIGLWQLLRQLGLSNHKALSGQLRRAIFIVEIGIQQGIFVHLLRQKQLAALQIGVQLAGLFGNLGSLVPDVVELIGLFSHIAAQFSEIWEVWSRM